MRGEDEMEWKSRVIPITVAVAAFAVVLAMPGWRDALAQASYYDSSFIGCTTDRAGDLVVTFSQGPGAPMVAPGSACEQALNQLAPQCLIEQETQAIDARNKAFGTMFRLQCPLP